MAKRELTISGPIVISSLMRGFVLSLVAGVVIGFLGPFGTFERLPLLWRLSFWIFGIVGGFLFHMPLYWLARYMTELRGWPVWVGVIGSAIAAAVPTTFLVNGIAISILDSVTTDSVLTLYPMVLAVSLPLQTIGHITAFKNRPDDSKPQALADKVLPDDASSKPVATIEELAPPPPNVGIAAQAPQNPSASSSFFDRLPKRLGQDLICLQMEDHYVRAFTTLGSEMILMRMADAVRELETVEGLLVHRSFWVARSAVQDWERDGKNLFLKLSNGKNVPVARDRQQHVKAAGWLSSNPR